MLFPFAAGLEDSDGVQKLIASAKLCLSDILARCDYSASGTLDAARWVPGWITPFHRCFRKAIKTGASSPIAHLINVFFQQMHDHLWLKEDSGPSAFSLLLRLLSTHFDHVDQGRAFVKLQAFVVPTGTVYSTCLRAFQKLALVVQGTEKICRPSDAMVIEVVRTSVIRQFPASTPVLYPGDLMSARELYNQCQSCGWHTTCMRLVIHQPSTAKNIFHVPPLEATRLFRRPRRHRHLLSRRVRVTRLNRARNATLLSPMSLRHKLRRTLTRSQ